MRSGRALARGDVFANSHKDGVSQAPVVGEPVELDPNHHLGPHERAPAGGWFERPLGLNGGHLEGEQLGPQLFDRALVEPAPHLASHDELVAAERSDVEGAELFSHPLPRGKAHHHELFIAGRLDL